MGLNMNYHFFLEGYQSHCHIPEYIRTNNSQIPSDEIVLKSTLEFANTCRNSVSTITSLSEEAAGPVQFEQIYSSLSAAIRAVDSVKTTMLQTIAEARDNVDRSRDHKNDPIESQYNIAERVKYLDKAIHLVSQYHPDDIMMNNITNLTANNLITDQTFPNLNAIKDILHGSSIAIPDNIENPSEYTSKLIVDKDAILYHLLGKYYSPVEAASIMQFAVNFANDFMPNQRTDYKITVQDYLTAFSNVNAVDDMIKYLDDLKATTEDAFNDCLKTMYAYCDSLKGATSENYKENYGTVVSATINNVQNIICAANIVTTRKVSIISNLYGATGDSWKVIDFAHSLISKYSEKIMASNVMAQDAGKDIPANAIVFNGADQVREFYDIQSQSNMLDMLIENAYNEYMYDDALEKVIQEATVLYEDDNSGNTNNGQAAGSNSSQVTTGNNTAQNSNSQQQTSNNSNQNTQQDQQSGTQNSANNNNTKAQKNKFGILNWLKQMMGRLGEAINKFKLRVEEMITKGPDKKFWTDNKDKIRNIDISGTEVNQWYQYKFDLFKNSTYIKFNPTDNALKSDTDLQDAILSKINGGTKPNINTDEKDTFATKINKVYQGEYINIENGNGKTLGDINYNKDSAFTFVNQFIDKGFNSESLGSITEDYRRIDEDYKDAAKRYDEYANQFKQTQSQNQAANSTGEPKSNGNTSGNQSGSNGQQQANAESAFFDFSSGFNLAECLGLMNCGNVINEADIKPDQSTAQSADQANGTIDNAELDKMIHRCFSMNISAITAKLTNAMAAYKQNMQLFKAVTNASAVKNKNNDNKKK
jgi:hypothetical protein